MNDQTPVQYFIIRNEGFLEDLELALLSPIFDDIFKKTDVLIDIIQKRSLDINYCILQIFNTKKLIKDKTNETGFEKVFESAESQSTIHQPP